IGADPGTEAAAGILAVDPGGYLLCGSGAANCDGHLRWPLTDREPHLLETVRPRVFAAGDVRSGASNRLAGAVGDGAMVVRLVQEILDGQPGGRCRQRASLPRAAVTKPVTSARHSPTLPEAHCTQTSGSPFSASTSQLSLITSLAGRAVNSRTRGARRVACRVHSSSSPLLMTSDAPLPASGSRACTIA